MWINTIQVSTNSHASLAVLNVHLNYAYALIFNDFYT